MTTDVADGVRPGGMAGQVGERAVVAPGDHARMRRVHWCLRVGAAGCFIGHGAFGIITKASWLPYFAVVGIPPDVAYSIMPVVGAIDIAAGITMLFSPRPIVLLYMTTWAIWTALLRPLAGESAFETIERAGNYGVPLAMLMLLGWPRSGTDWFRKYSSDAVAASRQNIARVLLLTTALLLFGHGALAAITGKALFAKHYAILGLPAVIAPRIGFVEMVIALLVMARPSPNLLIAIAAWKVATEALYPLAGTPIWEFIERFGSYAAPLALFLLWNTIDVGRLTFRRSHA